MAEKNGENLFDKIQQNISTVAFPNWSLDSLTVARYTKLVPNPNILTSVVNKTRLGGINASNVDEFINEYKQHGQLGNWFNNEITWNNTQNRAGKYQPPSWSGYYNDNDNDDWNIKRSCVMIINDITYKEICFYWKKANGNLRNIIG